MGTDWMRKSPLMDSAAPDSIIQDGEPIYCDTRRPLFIMSRGCGKSMLQLEMYRIFCGIPDDEWVRIKQETMRQMYGDDWDMEGEDEQ